MELKEHIAVFKKYKAFLLTFIVILTLVGAGLGMIQKPKYEASVALAIVQVQKQDTADYQYDDFYSLSAAELYGQTILSWFLTPSFVVDIYNEAGLDPTVNSIDKLARRFKVKQLSPQNLIVSFSDLDKGVAATLADAVGTVTETQSADLNQSQDQTDTFKVIASAPVIAESITPLWLTTIVGFFVGLIVGIILMYLVRYFKN